jgi:hypothetical protein
MPTCRIRARRLVVRLRMRIWKVLRAVRLLLPVATARQLRDGDGRTVMRVSRRVGMVEQLLDPLRLLAVVVHRTFYPDCSGSRNRSSSEKSITGSGLLELSEKDDETWTGWR